jgi:hypothetical protein
VILIYRPDKTVVSPDKDNCRRTLSARQPLRPIATGCSNDSKSTQPLVKTPAQRAVLEMLVGPRASMAVRISALTTTGMISAIESKLAIIESEKVRFRSVASIGVRPQIQAGIPSGADRCHTRQQENMRRMECAGPASPPS